MENGTEAEEQESGRGFDIKLIKSYLAFVRRAIAARKLTILAIMAVGVVLTALVVNYIPRTYTCTTVLTTVENAVLDADRVRPLAGSKSMVMRHENLEAIIKETDLVKKYPARRPPLLAFKDKIVYGLLGRPDDKTMVAILVGTLEGKISIDTEDNDLTIIVDWGDRFTAAEVAQATLDGFLKMRHKAEISAFQEKMGILDSHAMKMRDEIASLAEQMDAAANAAAAESMKSVAKTGGAAAPAKAAGGPALSLRPRTPISDEQLPELRERLATLKLRLTTAENERNARMRDEQGKLDELKLRLTPNHPQVITQDERVAMASQVSSELALLRSEVADLESQVKQRDAMMKAGGTPERGVGGRAAAAPASAEQLPGDVAMLLAREEGDPALRAQLSGAVVRYGSLRDDVRAAKLALDTAQAAFNHRYQVVIPVETPNRPTKPNLVAVAAGGFFLSLLLALLFPIIGELRRGVLVEYWQVDAFQLPVLADLRLPPAGKE